MPNKFSMIWLDLKDIIISLQNNSYNIIIALMQSLPHGEPTLLVSNYEKLHLQKLKNDILRYTNSGLRVVQQQWWKAMIDMLELEWGTSHQGGSWLLEELLQVKRTLALQFCVQISTSLQRPQHYIQWYQ